jgi:hypothetical protein
MAQVRTMLPAPDTVDTVADGTWWGYYFSDDEMYFIRFTYGRVVLVVKATRAELLPIYGRSTAATR